jgi:hypothetical protein
MAPAANSDAAGLSVSPVSTVLMADPCAKGFRPTNGRWVAAAGTGSSASLLGLPDLTISASNIALELNRPLGTAAGGGRQHNHRQLCSCTSKRPDG